jgi:hypothetical protein
VLVAERVAVVPYWHHHVGVPPSHEHMASCRLVPWDTSFDSDLVLQADVVVAALVALVLHKTAAFAWRCVASAEDTFPAEVAALVVVVVVVEAVAAVELAETLDTTAFSSAVIPSGFGAFMSIGVGFACAGCCCPVGWEANCC